MRRPQAYRLRFDGIWLGVAAMAISAAIVALIVIGALALLFSMQPAPVLP